MKILHRFVLLNVFLITTVGAWQQLGPNGVALRALSNVPGYPDELFIIAGGFPSYLYFTSNAGSSWSVRETISEMITALAINPVDVRIMYAAGRTRRVYKSTNSGESWFTAGNLPVGVWVQELEVNPDNGSEIWGVAELEVGDSSGLGFYYSTDGGMNWQGRVLGWSFTTQARALAISPDRPGRVFIGGSMGNRVCLLLTTDYGASWQDRSTGLGGSCVQGVAFVPTDSSTIVCATDSGVYYSTDLGITWTRRLSSPVYSVAFASVSPYYGYAGGENLIFRSTDLGITWRGDTVSTFAGTNTRFIAINPNLPLELFAGNGYGVFYSTNGGYNWVCRSHNFQNLDVAFLNFYSADTLFAGVEGYGIVRSTDAGRNWSLWGKMFPGVGWAKSLAINPRHPDSAVCVIGCDDKLHLTIDRGDSWESYPIAVNFQPAGVAYHPRGQDTLYAWGGKRDSVNGPLHFAIYRSTDRGQHWGSVMVREQGFCKGMIFSQTGDTIIAYGGTGGQPAIFRSIDRGRTWSSLVNGITGGPVNDLQVAISNPARWVCATPAGVFKSDNYGLFWTNLGLLNVTCVLLDTVDLNRIWAGTDTQGFYFTTNQGVSWMRDTIGVVGRSIYMLVSNPQRRSAVYAGVKGHSLLGKNIIGVSEFSNNYGSFIRLKVLPNAIRKSCRIEVSPVPARVELYDASGRWRTEIPVGAEGIIYWQKPDSVSAGVYLMVFKTPQGQATQKLVILQ